MSVIAAPDVELILDVRGLRKPPANQQEFGALWDLLEPALTGRDLRSRRVHELVGSDGTLRVEVARIEPGVGLVTSSTRFAVVAVREPSKLIYACKECAGRGVEQYGPFPCSDRSSGQEHRACDLHVVILDGALTPTCREHQPRCRECGVAATFWCAGRSCDRKVAWCARHRKTRPQDEDVAYCPACYARQFPPCESPGCQDIGTVTCEHVSRSLDPCGRRMCTKHARRWQVFGGEKMGLGRCSAHSRLAGLSAEELVFQIVAGASARRPPERQPSLQGFAHSFRNSRDPKLVKLALDYKAILVMLTSLGQSLRRWTAVPSGSPPPRALAAVEAAMPAWEDQYQRIGVAAVDGEQFVVRLRQIVQELLPRDGHAIAAAVTLAEYKPALPPRPGLEPRPARLFVHVPDQYRGLFMGKDRIRKLEYDRRLGVDVQIEGGRNRR